MVQTSTKRKISVKKIIKVIFVLIITVVCLIVLFFSISAQITTGESSNVYYITFHDMMAFWGGTTLSYVIFAATIASLVFVFELADTISIAFSSRSKTWDEFAQSCIS